MTFGDAPAAGPITPAADYDRFVDWNKRLAREAPFFRRLFDDNDVHTVIDVGCGTGRHAIMWAEWGLDVTGVDPSESMLAQARISAESAVDAIGTAGGSLVFADGGFGQLGSLALGPADAVTCTGNALPHVDGVARLDETFRDFAAVLRPGGVCVLHLLNHDRLIAGRLRSMPPVVRDAEDGTWVFLRVLDYVEDGIRFDFLTLHRPGGWAGDASWETESRRSVHTALPVAVLEEKLAEAGFTRIALYGNHDGKPFDGTADESVIVVATKG